MMAASFYATQELRAKIAELEAENEQLKKQRDKLLEALEKCKDPAIHAHIVAEKALTRLKEKA